MKYLLITFFALLSFAAHSQCVNFHKENCNLPSTWDYEFDSQSLSVPLFSGQSFRFKAVFYEGKDYFIGFCKEAELGEIKFRFLSEDIVIDNTYSESMNDNLEFIEFSNTATRIAIIEIKVGKTKVINTNERKCLGVIIGTKNTEN
ncbi:MAG: hypothetical protein JEZ09_05095 [Salinivirgaceae bacterium]|nr:hypothetical protein [Salinivirgaceae bacterium]